MRILISIFAITIILALSSCNRNGCPNQLEAQEIEVVE